MAMERKIPIDRPSIDGASSLDPGGGARGSALGAPLEPAPSGGGGGGGAASRPSITAMAAFLLVQALYSVQTDEWTHSQQPSSQSQLVISSSAERRSSGIAVATRSVRPIPPTQRSKRSSRLERSFRSLKASHSQPRSAGLQLSRSGVTASSAWAAACSPASRSIASSSSSSSSGGASPSSGGSSAAAASSSASGSEAEQSIAQLQAVLAVAHKYGVLRLLRWAEGQLCDKLSCEMACSLLSLAHVYGATELERNCLAFMKANMAQVVKRADFAALAPEALVKFHMHCAGVDPAEEEPGRKRKRDEE
mmetsp:Transcript_25602/g.83936  ORF Transcript_25602/g.83936 Transcript_25602/m.83936 type:complete len:307 (-) Transcript_25602:264-1184(-)